MAIQAQVNYNASNANQIGFTLTGTGGSEYPLVTINNNNDNLQTQKDFNQHALFHRRQSFLDVHMEKQRQEIDHFIRIQSERVRHALQEQRKQEMETLLINMEAKALVLMTQKEEEMSRALSKNVELENLLRKMEVENQTWQRMARENEAMVATLSSTLEQVRERASAAAEDEGSCCGGGESKMSGGCCCLNCGSDGERRVLFLPCRHLCCCTGCEAGLVHCPICGTPKKNRIEANTC